MINEWSSHSASIFNDLLVQQITVNLPVLLRPQSLYKTSDFAEFRTRLNTIFNFITDLFNEVHTQNTDTPQGDSLLTRKIIKKHPRL